MDQKAGSDMSGAPQNCASGAGDGEKATAAKTTAPLPGYMRSTSSTANRRMDSVTKRQTPLSRSNSVTRSFDPSQASSSSSSNRLNSSKKTSTPLRTGGQKLNFSNASAIADAPSSSAVPRRPLITMAGAGPGAGVAAKVRSSRRQSMSGVTVRAPLRAQAAGDGTLSDEIESDIRRSYLICSLRLLDKAKSARAAVEKKGLHAIWQYHQMISMYRKDIADLREKKRRSEALLPYAKQLKVLRDGLTDVALLESDTESSMQYIVEATRRKLSVLTFEHSGLPHDEAEKVLQQAEKALQSPELEKLPLIMQAFESYQRLKEKLDRISVNSEKCAQLIREMETMAIDDEKYRQFAELMPTMSAIGNRLSSDASD